MKGVPKEGSESHFAAKNQFVGESGDKAAGLGPHGGRKSELSTQTLRSWRLTCGQSGNIAPTFLRVQNHYRKWN